MVINNHDVRDTTDFIIIRSCYQNSSTARQTQDIQEIGHHIGFKNSK